MSSITTIILTYNEEQHISRCIQSVMPFSDSVVIIDSFSTDNTVQIARSLGAHVYQRSWTYHADQFNWALSNVPINSDWVFRIDADEYLISTTDISTFISGLPQHVSGVYIRRSISFLGTIIKHGGVNKLPILRLFRFGFGCVEDRFMDEHIVVRGSVVSSKIHIIDENKNNITWWTDKHNKYASLEAFEFFKSNYFHNNHNSDINHLGLLSTMRRVLKDKIYYFLPSFVRPSLYFIYRYLFRLGFLDGVSGFFFHILQGFWYRFLVEAKIRDVLISCPDLKFDDIKNRLDLK